MATKQVKKPENELATKPAAASLPAVIDEGFGEYAGAGLEGAGADSFAIPFLSVLQKGSPQVDEASGVAIEGAKGGMLYETVTGRLYSGKTGVLIAPCAYRKVYLRWGPRGGEGGGFKGELDEAQVAHMRASGEIKELDGRMFVALPDGSVNDKKCDRISDTRNHYCLIVDEETGGWNTALLSLTSTQIKKSKILASMISSRKAMTSVGPQTPPSWANLVRVTTVPESNDKGTWFGVRFEIEGDVIRPRRPDGSPNPLFDAGRDFNKLVREGLVQAKYEDTEGGHAPAPGKF